MSLEQISFTVIMRGKADFMVVIPEEIDWPDL